MFFPSQQWGKLVFIFLFRKHSLAWQFMRTIRKCFQRVWSERSAPKTMMILFAFSAFYRFLGSLQKISFFLGTNEEEDDREKQLNCTFWYFWRLNINFRFPLAHMKMLKLNTVKGVADRLPSSGQFMGFALISFCSTGQKSAMNTMRA